VNTPIEPFGKTKAALKKSCFKCCLLWFSGVLAFATILVAFLFGYAGRWLSEADAPRPADAVVVLGGAFERTLYAADLYASGYARRIYLSDPVPEASHRLLEQIGINLPTEYEISTAILKHKGVAPEDVLRFPGTVLSTADEGELLRQLFAGQHLTIMIVTSPYHVRRARLVIGNALANTQVNAFFVATPYERYATDWWNDQNSARYTILELAKIIYYIAGGRFRAAN
jgi:uncharacterized SAM-binding protein YcdF (DUF218 family)